MKRAIIIISLLVWSFGSIAQQIPNFNAGDTGGAIRAILNSLVDEYNRELALDGFVRANNGAISSAVSIIPLDAGGLGVAISDPNGDRVLYWNDTNNQFEFAEVTGGLNLENGTIQLGDDVYQSQGYANIIFVKTPSDGGNDGTAQLNSFSNAYATIQAAITASDATGENNLIYVFAPKGVERLFLEPVDVSETTNIFYQDGVIHYWNVAGRPTMRTIGDGLGVKELNIFGSGQLYHTVGKSGNDSDALTTFFGANWNLDVELRGITNANFGRALKSDFRDMEIRYAVNPPTTVDGAETVFHNCRFLSPPVLSNLGFIDTKVKFMNCDFDLLSQSEYEYSTTGRLYEITTGISHMDPFTTNTPNNFTGYINTEATADVAATIVLYSNFGGFRPDFVSAIEIYYNQPPTETELIFEECNFNIYKTHCIGIIALTNQNSDVTSLLFRNSTVNDYTTGETASSLFATNSATNQIGLVDYGGIRSNADLKNQVAASTYVFELENNYEPIESQGGLLNLQDDGANVINTATGTGYFNWGNLRLEDNTIFGLGGGDIFLEAQNVAAADIVFRTGGTSRGFIGSNGTWDFAANELTNIDFVSTDRLTATGDTEINGITYPSADGSTGQVITTDGSGSLSFSSVASSVGTNTLNISDGSGSFSNTRLNYEYRNAVESVDLYLDTSDGSDNRRLTLNGGGASMVSRGAALVLYGNEFSELVGLEGDAVITLGEATGSQLRINDGTMVQRLNVSTAGVTIDEAYTLPTVDGTAGQSIVTDGLGNLSFSTVGTPSFGAALEIPFINLTGNDFQYSPSFFYDGTTRLDVGYGLNVVGAFNSGIVIQGFVGSGQIAANTVDGTDNFNVTMTGGGTTNQTRGGFVQVRGNESSSGGGVSLVQGNVAGADIRFIDRSGDTAGLIDETGGWILGSAAGAGQGLGTINTTGVFVNGVAVGGGGSVGALNNFNASDGAGGFISTNIEYNPIGTNVLTLSGTGVSTDAGMMDFNGMSVSTADPSFYGPGNAFTEMRGGPASATFESKLVITGNGNASGRTLSLKYGNANQFLVDNNGDWNFQNNNITGVDNFRSANYVPTITPFFNVTTGSNIYSSFQRIGDHVTFQIKVSVTPTAGLTDNTRFRISLPVPTNFANADQVAGVVTVNGGAAANNGTGIVVSVSATNDLIVAFTSFSTAAHDVVIVGSYPILP